MFWVVSNTYKYETVSNEWCFLHFKPWKQKIEIYQHFSLILCNFWRQNCLKTWILVFWTTLVNSCWPRVCDMTKYILGACKYLSQVLSPPNIISRNAKLIMGGGRKKRFFVPRPRWWNNHLHYLLMILQNHAKFSHCRFLLKNGVLVTTSRSDFEDFRKRQDKFRHICEVSPIFPKNLK